MSVTLIFPVFNKVDLLARALTTLRATTYRDFVVHVVDDGSTEDIESLARAQGQHYPIRFDRLQHTGNSTVVVNWAALRAETTHIAYMNSDVEFPDSEWLGASMGCFEKFETEEPLTFTDGKRKHRVGAVGIKQLFAPWQKQWAGMVGHVGNVYREDGTWQHLEEFVPDAQSKYREDGIVEGVTGCGLITPIDIWREVGGFEMYPVFGWDDCAYSLQVQALGYRVVCQRRHPFFHVRSASYGAPKNPLYYENKDLIRLRYGRVIDALLNGRER